MLQSIVKVMNTILVRSAASLERLARPRVKYNGLTPPDGTND